MNRVTAVPKSPPSCIPQTWPEGHLVVSFFINIHAQEQREHCLHDGQGAGTQAFPTPCIHGQLWASSGFQ